MLRGAFRRDALTGERHFRWRGGDVSRLEGLADAVFALALTLLVVRLEVPASFLEVKYAILHSPVYLVCFSLFVWIWYCHHQFHRRYGLEGPGTVALDAAILFVVLLFALPLRFVAELIFAEFFQDGGAIQRHVDGTPRTGPGGDAMPMLDVGDGTFLLAIYAGGFALVFGLFLVQTYSAHRLADALELDEVERLVTRNTMRAHGLSMSIGLIALALVLMGGSTGRLAPLVFFLMGPGHGLLGFAQGRAVERLAAELGTDRSDASDDSRSSGRLQ